MQELTQKSLVTDIHKALKNWHNIHTIPSLGYLCLVQELVNNNNHHSIHRASNQVLLDGLSNLEAMPSAITK